MKTYILVGENQPVDVSSNEESSDDTSQQPESINDTSQQPESFHDTPASYQPLLAPYIPSPSPASDVSFEDKRIINFRKHVSQLVGTSVVCSQYQPNIKHIGANCII